ncbi:MAG: enoyl-CoA hydratase-related protein, partial [Dehalococcoidia bacterium]|nr:enoyl-CoA hydratase-related protein [Dehalococcoidia bacterium]
MDYEDIVYEVEGGIATITLYRPDKLNAQTQTMTQELNLAFDEAEADDAIRAVVVTGAGRAFCAGSDMSAGPARELPEAARVLSEEEQAARGGNVTNRIFDFPKPVIAAVNGAAVGFGASTTLAMDIRIGSTAARFGFVYARRGITPESAASWYLPRIVGVEQALRWMYSGEVFGAD